jgi:hypothetical protein
MDCAAVDFAFPDPSMRPLQACRLGASNSSDTASVATRFFVFGRFLFMKDTAPYFRTRVSILTCGPTGLQKDPQL